MRLNRAAVWAACVLIPSLPGGATAGPAVTEAAVRASAEAFARERADSAGRRLDADLIRRADALAARAAESQKAGDLPGARRGYRDARWLLPALPPDLPADVDRVYGDARLKHAGKVTRVAVSPDGTRVASASVDGTVKVIDPENRREVVIYRGHQSGDAPPGGLRSNGVLALAWSPDGKTIASGGGGGGGGEGGGEVHLWTPADGKLVRVLAKAAAPVQALAFHPDGGRLAVGADDYSVRVFDTAKGEIAVDLGKAAGKVNALAYSPDGSLLALADAAGQVQLYRPTAAEAARLAFNGQPIRNAYGVAFSPDGRLLYVCGDNVVMALSAVAGAPGLGAKVRDFEGLPQQANALAVTPDGARVAVACKDRVVRLLDASDGRLLRALTGHLDAVESVALSPDGSLLVSGSTDHHVRLWDLTPTDGHRALSGHAGPVWAAVGTPDGRRVATAGRDRLIRVWDAASGKVTRELAGHGAAVTALAVTPDGKTLVSASGDRLLKVWDLETGKHLRDLKGHTGAVLALALSADGRFALSGGADRAARWWDVSTGEAVQTLPEQAGSIAAVAIRPDGGQFALGQADGTLTLWDARSKAEAGRVAAHVLGVSALAYRPDGRTLATAGGDAVVRLWNLAGGPPDRATAAELKGHVGAVSAISFAPDGATLITGGADQTLRLWAADGGRELRTLRGHADWVAAAGFLPGGQLLSAGVDGTARLWDTPRGEESLPLGHGHALTCMAASTDGTRVASGSIDGTVRVWDAETAKELFALAAPPTAERQGDDEDNLVPRKSIRAVSFSPDGTKIVSASNDQSVRVWDANTRAVSATVRVGGTVSLIDCLSDGRGFLVWGTREEAGGFRQVVQVFGFDGRLLSDLSDTQPRDGGQSISSHTHDGSHMAFSSTAGVVRVFDLKTGKSARPELPAVDRGQTLADIVLMAGAKRLVTVDERSLAKVWDLDKREVERTIQLHDGRFFTLMGTRDGKRILTFDNAGEVRVWDIATGAKVASWKMPTPVVIGNVSADGKFVFTANGDTTLSRFRVPQ